MKIRTTLSKEIQKERYALLNKFSITIIILGVIMISYFIYRIVTKDVRIFDSAIFVIGLFSLGVGVGLLLIIRSTYKKAEILNLYSDTTFNDDYFYVELYENEELLATEKVYYHNCINYMETPNYVFLTTHRGETHGVSKEEGLVNFLSYKIRKINKK